MKKLILDFRATPPANRSLMLELAQFMLFMHGFCWAGAKEVSRDTRFFEGDEIEALVVNASTPNKPSVRWNHILKYNDFTPEVERQQRENGAEIFDANSIHGIAGFCDAIAKLVKEKTTTTATAEIKGVQVHMGVNGIIMDASDLLEEVLEEAKKKWQSEFQMG